MLYVQRLWLKLGCGPVLNMKNGGSRKEEYVLF